MNHLVQTVRPGLLFGENPERKKSAVLTPADQWFLGLLNGWRNPVNNFAGFQSRLKAIMKEQHRLELMEPALCQETIERYRTLLQQHSLDEASATNLFATIFVAIKFIHGITLHPQQLFAGWAMLQGNIVEMSTGEGKTLTATLPAIVVAMTGTPVHVITVNDYLVERDAGSMASLYEFFGLSVGFVTASMSDHDRHKAYQSDVVYGTNKQIVFDYLRDQQQEYGYQSGLKSRIRTLLSSTPDTPMMRGLCFAIVDEADSAMIDDARTPLILAEPKKTERSSVTESTVALAVSRNLHEGADFRIQFDTRTVWLTETGQDALRGMADRLGGVWRFERYRNELIRQALSALYLYRKDRDYLVRSGRVELIDEATGRTTPDKKLQHGLHRMLELKENCLPSDENVVKSSLSFQSFFGRYCNLTGMSGTVHEVRLELKKVYGKNVIRIPTNRKNLRVCRPTVVMQDKDQQLEYLLKEVRRYKVSGQPLLIGTRTVELSESISKLLHLHGMPHALLNARQDADEAALVAMAGAPGTITVATNMAGRGTDIPLHGNAAVLGGLHVINLEINESSRIDRQLFGRAARQGDPGSCQSILSLHDDILMKYALTILSNSAVKAIDHCPGLGQWLALRLVQLAQFRCESAHRKQRFALFRWRDQLERELAIGGEGP